MNFLAHLWLADRAALPLAGAILGDVLHGALPPAMPAPLARSVRLHRRIDAATDRHPCVREARRQFGPGARRYAGILLDLLFDHVLARDWARHGREPLDQFADRAARDVAAEARWFEHARHPVPQPLPFAALLLSYGAPSGFERAVQRTAQRLRRPEGLLDALAGWQSHVPRLERDLPVLLEDLAAVSAEPSLRPVGAETPLGEPGSP